MIYVSMNTSFLWKYSDRLDFYRKFNFFCCRMIYIVILLLLLFRLQSFRVRAVPIRWEYKWISMEIDEKFHPLFRVTCMFSYRSQLYDVVNIKSVFIDFIAYGSRVSSIDRSILLRFIPLICVILKYLYCMRIWIFSAFYLVHHAYFGKLE